LAPRIPFARPFTDGETESGGWLRPGEYADLLPNEDAAQTLMSPMGAASGAKGATALKLALYKAAFAGQAGTVTTFRMSGVPSAVGLTARKPGGVATSNVYWTHGHCVLGSGLELPTGGSMPAAEVNAPVVAGITSQNARMATYCG
jgi:hypothetical protein